VYLSHFNLKRKPFVTVPDPRELFQTEGHKELRSRLQLALEDHEPTLILGDNGIGKSTSLHSVLTALDRRAYHLIELSDPRLNRRSLYRALAIGLRLSPAYSFGALVEQVRVALAELAEKAQKTGKTENVGHPVLVVDNGELLTEDALDSFRLMTNPLLGQLTPCLTLLLVGDLSLGRRLKQPHFESFVQRLRVTYRMPSVGEDECRRYVAHRVRIAGGNPDIFDPAAVDVVLAEANGSLRSIDSLCSQALYAAFIAKANVVTKPHVQAVVADRSLGA
jgi:type II secretory pathway predicted ATPase ExeA